MEEKKLPRPTSWVVNFLPVNGKSTTFGPFPTAEKAREWMLKDVEHYLERVRENFPEEMKEISIQPEHLNDWTISFDFLDFLDENSWWEVTELQPVTD